VAWGEAHLKMLTVLTNLLSDTFLKVESEEKINAMAYTDPLTGLPNRVYFNLRLEQAVAWADEKNKRAAVVFIDLDAFKSVNDTMGHEGGDAILKMVGQRLAGSLPPDGAEKNRFGYHDGV
jgi:diguanylate cyclase (GGDEF)-like protein